MKRTQQSRELTSELYKIKGLAQQKEKSTEEKRLPAEHKSLFYYTPDSRVILEYIQNQSSG